MQIHSLLIQEIKDRLLKRNKNWIAVITGETGTGKSFSALRLAELIDPNFDPELQIVFSAKDFFKLINSGKLHKGSVILWDEAGIGMSSKEWYEVDKIEVNKVLQTFRWENIGLIMTVPSLSFIIPDNRKLIHAYIETQKILYDQKQVICKYFIVQHNPRFNCIYMKYPKFRLGGKRITLERLKINLPSKELLAIYEPMKRRFSISLREDAEDKSFTKRKSQKELDIENRDKAVDGLRQNWESYLNPRIKDRKCLDLELIMQTWKLGVPSAKVVKKTIEQEINKDGTKTAEPKGITQERTGQ